MSSGRVADIDMVEELRMRRWARQNWVPAEQRQRSWHEVIHEEMTRKDAEVPDAEPVLAGAAY